MSAPDVLDTKSAVNNALVSSITLPSLPTGSGGVLVLTVGHGSQVGSISGEATNAGEALNLAAVDTWYKIATTGTGATQATHWVARGTPAVPTVTFTGTAARLAAAIQRVGPVLAGAFPLLPLHYIAAGTTLPGFWVPPDSLVVEHVGLQSALSGQTLDARMTQTALIDTSATSGSRRLLAGKHAAAANARVADYVGTFTTAGTWAGLGLLVKGDTAPATWPTVPTPGSLYVPTTPRSRTYDGTRWSTA